MQSVVGPGSTRGPEALPSIADFAAAYRSGSTTPSQVAGNIAAAVAAARAWVPAQVYLTAFDEGLLHEQAAESTSRCARIQVK